MLDLVSYNGITSLPDKTLIAAFSLGVLYGKGIFTTIPLEEGHPLLWEKHWRRLAADAKRVKIDLNDLSRNIVRKALDDLIEKNDLSAGRARITIFDESASSLWQYETTAKTSLLITTGDVRYVPNNFRVTLSPYRVNSQSPLAGVKSCNYLENLMAVDEARERGFDEAIRLNERGEITSACMANVFWLKDDRLYTPSLKTGCLPGTTREFVMENIECREVEAGEEVLSKADAVFLTSAGIGVVRAARLDERTLPDIDHPILHLLP
jgi:branched-chain amino acid aminotransferase